jgi:hypothetical protein
MICLADNSRNKCSSHEVTKKGNLKCVINEIIVPPSRFFVQHKATSITNLLQFFSHATISHMAQDTAQSIFSIIQRSGPLSVLAIRQYLLKEYGIRKELDEINRFLYGTLREQLIRDKDEAGYPLWRIKQGSFEAAQGLEVMLYSELLRRGIVHEDDSHLGYAVRNRRNGKTYDLDIAVIKDAIKLDIEIDGFEHIRADARLSIQEQIEERGQNTEIEIDWMDNDNSFVKFKYIDNKSFFKWCMTHKDWCKKYHEELLKPHDITRNMWLIENGWKVMRFWNFEVKEEMERCVEEVKELLTY